MAFLDPWFLITQAGAPEVWFIITLLIGLIGFLKGANGRNLRKFSATVLIALIITFLMVTLVKEITHVPRPCSLLNPYCYPDYSFPSAHAAVVFMFFTAVALTDNKLSRKSVYRSLPFGVLASIVAFSRVALGVHTMPDVVAGAVLGIGISGIIWTLFWEIIWKDRKKVAKSVRTVKKGKTGKAKNTKASKPVR